MSEAGARGVWAVVPAGGQGGRLGGEKPGLPLAGPPPPPWGPDRP